MPRINPIAGIFAALLALGTGFAALPGVASSAEVPFGDKVGASVVNYDRTTPFIATAGLLQEGAVAELKALGFTAILDLRGPEEGTAAERAAVEAAGLKYFNIPVTDRAPTDEQVRQFAVLAEDPANYPLMVHCVSANRSGAIWTLYRVSRGVPFEIAIEEGRTAGLKPSREQAVRARLGQPPLSE
jgi:uncharacterized protein (TIGR01244 family)